MFSTVFHCDISCDRLLVRCVDLFSRAAVRDLRMANDTHPLAPKRSESQVRWTKIAQATTLIASAGHPYRPDEPEVEVTGSATAAECAYYDQCLVLHYALCSPLLSLRALIARELSALIRSGPVVASHTPEPVLLPELIRLIVMYTGFAVVSVTPASATTHEWMGWYPFDTPLIKCDAPPQDVFLEPRLSIGLPNARVMCGATESRIVCWHSDRDDESYRKFDTFRLPEREIIHLHCNITDCKLLSHDPMHSVPSSDSSDADAVTRSLSHEIVAVASCTGPGQRNQYSSDITFFHWRDESFVGLPHNLSTVAVPTSQSQWVLSNQQYINSITCICSTADGTQLIAVGSCVERLSQPLKSLSPDAEATYRRAIVVWYRRRHTSTGSGVGSFRLSHRLNTSALSTAAAKTDGAESKARGWVHALCLLPGNRLLSTY